MPKIITDEHAKRISELLLLMSTRKMKLREYTIAAELRSFKFKDHKLVVAEEKPTFIYGSGTMAQRLRALAEYLEGGDSTVTLSIIGADLLSSDLRGLADEEDQQENVIATESATPSPQRTISFRYRNYKGVIHTRTIYPYRLFEGNNAWHPDTQWLLEGLDIDRGDMRQFALSDILKAADDPELINAVHRAVYNVRPSTTGFLFWKKDIDFIDASVLRTTEYVAAKHVAERIIRLTRGKEEVFTVEDLDTAPLSPTEVV